MVKWISKDTLSKMGQNKGFLWPAFSLIRTESKIPMVTNTRMVKWINKGKLPKIYQNRGFLWPVFFYIRTEYCPYTEKYGSEKTRVLTYLRSDMNKILTVFWGWKPRTKKKNTELDQHPPGVVSIKTCSENMQQIYRRTPMRKCDFNKAAKQF